MADKEELVGFVSYGFNVKTADGLLTKGDRVKISDENEVELVDTTYDFVLGYVAVANTETSGKCTVHMPQVQRVKTEDCGGAFSAGDFVMTDASDEVIKAAGAFASGTVTVVDYNAVDAGDTVVVNGVTLTAGGTDFTAATSNAATAASLASAINQKVPGVKATVASGAGSGVVTITALVEGRQGNLIALSTTAASDEMTVSGSVLSGGKDYAPAGIAFTDSAGASSTADIGWFK